MASFTSTLSALAKPRRSLPIAGVVAALVVVQLYYSDPRAGLVPLVMSVGFFALGPWSWRRLRVRGRSPHAMLLYVGGAVATVALGGILLPRLLGLGPTFLTDDGSLAIAAVLYLVGSWGLGRDIELEQDLEHVRLQAIRAHLDPHFLYNTLNAIAEWCREDPAVAEEATVRLAELLRAVLEALELRRWPLARELALVDALLELHRIRDGAAFTSTVDIEAAATTTEVAPLLVVSLVENALKHGPRNGHRGPITITIRTTAHGVRCEIENPGSFAPNRLRAGRGLATLQSRLTFAYGKQARFAIGPIGPTRTLAILELGTLGS